MDPIASPDVSNDKARQLPPESLIEVFFHKMSQSIGALSAALEVGSMSRDPAQLRAAIDHGMPQMERLLWLFDVTRRFFATDFRANSCLVSVRKCLEDAVKDALPLAESAQISLETAISRDAMVLANPAHLRDAIENVLITSIREGNPGSKVSIEVSERDDRCCVLICDETPYGDSTAQSIFDPFPAGTDTVGQKSANLDLALSRSIVRAFDGDLTMEPRVNGLRQFVILLPLAPPNS
ncbi:MAG: sensor histidine kinase [Terriglobales bacterium]